MKRPVSVLVLFASLVVGSAQPAAAQRWVSGYYAGWTVWEYPPSAVDYSSLTHLMVFSILPRNDGSIDTTLFIDPTNGPLVAKELAQRAHAAGKKAILTIGGEGTQGAFRGATSASNIDRFVQNIVGTVNAWGYDGVDIDWEPILSTDFGPMLSLVSKLRAAKPSMVITADVYWLNANFALTSSEAAFYSQLAVAVDQMNVMTYGMADNWGGWVSWHSSAVLGEGPDHPSSIHSTATMYIAAGVPPSKLGIGIGFYGSCWNSPVSAPLQPLGSAHVVASDNDISFANIKRLYYRDANYRYDSAAHAPYLSFSTPTGPAGCSFISYEDERSVAAKAQYVHQMGLGGTIIWQLAEGYVPGAADPNSLLRTVGQSFLGSAPPPSPTTSVQANGGTPQQTSAGQPFATPLRARVVDSTGAAIGGVAVTFRAPDSGASATFNGVTSVVVRTDAAGIATVPALANSRTGSYTVTASIAESTTPANFALTNTPAAPLALAEVGGSPQSAVVRQAFPQVLRLRIVDAYGNPVPGLAVTFTAPTSGASATFNGRSANTANTQTNDNGIAQSPAMTANRTAGSYTVVATISGYPVTFNLTNLPRK